MAIQGGWRRFSWDSGVLLLLSLGTAGGRVEAEGPASVMPAAQTAASGWSVDPATGALNIEVPLQQVPGEIPIRLHLRFVATGSATGHEVLTSGQREGEARWSSRFSEDRGGAQVFFVSDIPDPDTVSLPHWVLLQGAGTDLDLDGMFGLKRITWDEPGTRCHRGGGIISYHAPAEGLGSWTSLARSLEPEGFGADFMDDRFTVFFTNHQAQIFRRVRWSGNGDKYLPILWIDRFGHKVTFKWRQFWCMDEREGRPDVRSISVRAVNDHGLGLHGQWAWRDKDPEGTLGVERMFLSDVIGFQAPSVDIHGHDGFRSFQKQLGLWGRPDFQKAGRRGMPTFIPTSIVFVAPREVGRHHVLEQDFDDVPATKPWTKAVAWRFRYTEGSPELASMTDPGDVTTRFEYEPHAYYTTLGSSSPFVRHKPRQLAEHIIYSVRSAVSEDPASSSRHACRWAWVFPGAVRSKEDPEHVGWRWPLQVDGSVTPQTWTATLTQTYERGAFRDEMERHWVFAAPPMEEHHVANAALLEEEYRSGGRVWARRRNTLASGGVDDSLSLVRSTVHSMDGRPDVREDFTWDVTGSRLLRHSLWTGGRIWEATASKFRAVSGELDPGRLRSRITQRRVGRDLATAHRHDFDYLPSGQLSQERRIGVVHEGLESGYEAYGATAGRDGSGEAVQPTGASSQDPEAGAEPSPLTPPWRRQTGRPIARREGVTGPNPLVPPWRRQPRTPPSPPGKDGADEQPVFFSPPSVIGEGHPFSVDDGRRLDEAVLVASYTYDKEGRMAETARAFVPSGSRNAIGTDVTRRTLGPLGLPVREDVRYATGTEVDAGYSRTWSYDDQGQPIFQEDAYGVPTRIDRDSLGRVIRRQRAGEPVVSFDYKGTGAGNRMEWTSSDGRSGFEERDGFGRVLFREGPEGVREAFQYDGAGRVLEHLETRKDGVSRSRCWAYDPLGRLQRYRTFESPMAVTYRYLREGDLARVDALASDGVVQSSWSDPLGRVVRTQGPGKTVETEFNAENQPLRILTTSGGSQHEQRFAYSPLGAMRSRSAPETGTVTYSAFGPAGKPCLINDGVRTWRIDYDGLGRVRHMDDGQGGYVAYGYRGPYLLTARTRCSGVTVEEAYSYLAPEKGGRLASCTQTFGGKTWGTSYSYDQHGRLLEIDYPSRHTSTYHYDDLGRVDRVALDGKAILQVSRDGWGRRSELAFASGARDLWTWDAPGAHLSGILLKPVGEGELSMPYVYDGSGHLTRGGGWDKLLHDPLGRLLSAEGFGGRLAFGYGIGGNNLAFLGAPTHPGWNNFTFSPQDQGRVPSLQANGALTNWFQNAHGDASTVGTASGSAPALRVHWDGLGRISGIRCPELELDQEYIYGCSGLRVLTEDKARPGRSRAYVYGPGGELLGEYRPDGGWIREVIYLGNTAIAELDAEGVHELHCDHLGTPRLITHGTTGKLEGTQLFAPFGERYPAPWTSGYMPLAGFTGHLQQDSTGLIYMRSRFYSPAWHRFLNADPGSGSYEALGAFVYADGSPLEGADFTGMGWISDLFEGIGDALNWNENRKYVVFLAAIAAPHFVAPAVANFLGGSWAAEVVGGMVGGAVGGAIGGGDLESAGQGAIIGGLLAGADLAAARWVSTGPNVRAARTLVRSMTMAAYGAARGIDPLLCAGFSAAMDVMGYWYEDIVGWKPTSLSGENRGPKTYKPVKTANGWRLPKDAARRNIGGLNKLAEEVGPVARAFVQQGPVSKVLNVIPCFNNVAGFRDTWILNLPPGAVANFGTMLPSALVGLSTAYGQSAEAYRQIMEEFE